MHLRSANPGCSHARVLPRLAFELFIPWAPLFCSKAEIETRHGTSDQCLDIRFLLEMGAEKCRRQRGCRVVDLSAIDVRRVGAKRRDHTATRRGALIEEGVMIDARNYR
jgi:hypothetical protein